MYCVQNEEDHTTYVRQHRTNPNMIWYFVPYKPINILYNILIQHTSCVKKAGFPGSLGVPKTCNAVSHVRVNGLTTTKSNAVNDREPLGRLARYSFNASDCAIPLGVNRESYNACSVAGASPRRRQWLDPVSLVATL